MRSFLFIAAIFTATLLRAQLSNNTFLQGPAAPETKWGGTFEALQYLKNNEYFNNINPGATLIGFQTRALMHYRVSSHATFSAGGLLQREFGDQKGLSKAIPVFNFQFRKGNWNWNLGNVMPNIHHKMAEPLLDYENIIKNPVEGGIQGVRKTQKMFYDFWLEWRQLANGLKDLQEKIVFGQSFEATLLNTSSVNLSMPVQAVVYHQGGQALNLNGHVATRINGGTGLRFRTRDTGLLLEGLFFGSIDNSQTHSQPFNNGWAQMVNLRFRFLKFHEITLTGWNAREFVTNTGSPVFGNVNMSDAYANRNTRTLAMLRYVLSRPIVGNKIWVDFRLEPYYDFQAKSVEFSQGLYFRYVESINIRLPRWMGM